MKDTLSSRPLKYLSITVALAISAAAPARAQTSANERPATATPAPADTATAPQPAGTPPAGAPPAITTATTPPPPTPPAPAPPALPPPPGERVRSSTVDALPFTEAPAGTRPAGPSWFTRAPLRLVLGGNGSDKSWALTFVGVIEADYITDSTRSYNESVGGSLVARSDTYEGTVGRTQFSMRNTRVGMVLDSPMVGGVTPSAVLQGDFAGNQPGVPYIAPGMHHGAGGTISENHYYNSPTFRIRHAFLALRSRYADVIAGQTFDLFGWQNYYLATSLLGLPNQLASRTTQLRVSHTFAASGPVAVDVAVAAVRPGQRDGQVPDGQAGVRIAFNGWKGITTPGVAQTIAAPLSIGVSGVVRQFKVNSFTPPPVQASNHAMGWGASLDVFVPIIPAANSDDRANRLSLVGSYVVGTGIADYLATGGGARFPTLPNPAQASPPPLYTPDIDNGLVSFDVRGVLHTIDWWAAKGGLQYYFPGSGRLFFAGNFTYAESSNIGKLFPRGGAEIELLGTVADTSLSGDASLLWDATPAVRLGISSQYTRVRYLDGDKPNNVRGIFQALYIF